MPTRRHTVAGTAILAVSAGLGWHGCVDPAKSFSDFENRVIDGAPIDIGGSCNGGEIPDVNGEFFLGLAPSFAPAGVLKF